MKYEIYHSKGGMNHSCEPKKYEYVHVTSVYADTLNEAFMMAQNDFNLEYAARGVRSTSVGDIIGYTIENQNLYKLVEGMGFSQVNKVWIEYKMQMSKQLNLLTAIPEEIEEYESIQEAITALMEQLDEDLYLVKKRNIKGFGMTNKRVVDLLPELWAEQIK